MTFKAGELVLLGSGEYSDYSVECIARARRDGDTVALLAEFHDAGLDLPVNGRVNRFIAWLTRDDGPLEEVPHREWLVGLYSEIKA